MKFVKTLPPKAGGPGRKPVEKPVAWSPEADKLRSRPGEWALLNSFEKHGTASVLASEIKRGKYLAFRPAGTYEAATRKRNGRTRVYARYVGK